MPDLFIKYLSNFLENVGYIPEYLRKKGYEKMNYIKHKRREKNLPHINKPTRDKEEKQI